MNAKKVKYGDRVVVVRVSSDEVTAHIGHICSTDGTSHIRADNREFTVVSGDEPFNLSTDSSDDAYERSMSVRDPHLLSITEAENLRNTPHAVAWFRNFYPPKSRVAEKIAKVLRRMDFAKKPSVFSV